MERIGFEELHERLVHYEHLSFTVEDVGERARVMSPAQHALPELNIVLCGEVGVGKSSLLSSMYRALNPDRSNHPIAPVGRLGGAASALDSGLMGHWGEEEQQQQQHEQGASSHAAASSSSSSSSAALLQEGAEGDWLREESHTQRYAGYSLNPPQGTVRAFDTKGLFRHRAKDQHEHLRAIVRGIVRENTEVKQSSRWSLWDYLNVLWTWNPAAVLDPSCVVSSKGVFSEGVSMGDWVAHPFMRKPHAVVFVFPANQYGIPDSLIKFVETVRRQGHEPVFAVTKIDCHGGNSHDVYAGAGLFEEKKAEIVDRLHADPADVFPIHNYVQWNLQERSKDKLALRLLHRAVIRAEEFCLENYYEAAARKKDRCWLSLM